MGMRVNAWPDEIFRWIEAGAPQPERFAGLALGLFAHQFAANPAYRNYCEALGATPRSVASWEQIPALPCDAFKLPELPVRCFPAAAVARTFLTSGTTSGQRGRHELATTSFYDLSVRRGWQHLGLPALANPWFLSQPPAAAPESSLVHMFATLAGTAAADAPRWLLRDARHHLEALRQAAAAGAPVQLLGTALAFLEVVETTAPLELPAGSWLMETGGYKGSARSMEKAELYALLGRHFGLAPGAICNEYGMTEISSPFYTHGLGQPHRGAPWTGVRVIDPHSGQPAPDGESGYLEIVDLANVGSVLAVRTQDFAIRHGAREFTLLGRDPGALPRGCSRGAEEFFATRR